MCLNSAARGVMIRLRLSDWCALDPAIARLYVVIDVLQSGCSIRCIRVRPWDRLDSSIWCEPADWQTWIFTWDGSSIANAMRIKRLPDWGIPYARVALLPAGFQRIFQADRREPGAPRRGDGPWLLWPPDAAGPRIGAARGRASKQVRQVLCSPGMRYSWSNFIIRLTKVPMRGAFYGHRSIPHRSQQRPDRTP